VALGYMNEVQHNEFSAKRVCEAMTGETALSYVNRLLSVDSHCGQVQCGSC